MILLQQLVEMAKKKKKKKPSMPNLVAKHAQRSGAGAHQDKEGKHASRRRQQQQWKKEEGM